MRCYVNLVSDESALLLWGPWWAPWVRQGSSPSAWRAEMLLPCLSTGGLCCFVLLQLPLTVCADITPRLSLRFYFAPTLSLLIVCAFLSFFHLPKHYSPSLHLFNICPCLNLPLSFPSLVMPLFLLLLLLSATCISDSILVNSPPPPHPAFAVLWRSTEAVRTDGLRWFPGSTHFYRKQPGTAAAWRSHRVSAGPIMS